MVMIPPGSRLNLTGVADQVGQRLTQSFPLSLDRLHGLLHAHRQCPCLDVLGDLVTDLLDERLQQHAVACHLRSLESRVPQEIVDQVVCVKG
jgi:hypothetical protein